MKKKFKIRYRPSLGEYLDDINVQWGTVVKGDNEYIELYLKDAMMLFDVACNYTKWHLKQISKEETN